MKYKLILSENRFRMLIIQLSQRITMNFRGTPKITVYLSEIIGIIDK